MTKTESPFKDELKKATHELTFQSESDYPVEPLHIEGRGRKALAAKDILEVRKHPAKTSVKKTSIDDLFRTATKAEDWHGPEEQKSVKRFQVLVRILKENLTGIQVFKVGKVESDVYVVGKTQSGDFAGVTTKIVET